VPVTGSCAKGAVTRDRLQKGGGSLAERSTVPQGSRDSLKGSLIQMGSAVQRTPDVFQEEPQEGSPRASEQTTLPPGAPEQTTQASTREDAIPDDGSSGADSNSDVSNVCKRLKKYSNTERMSKLAFGNKRESVQAANDTAESITMITKLALDVMKGLYPQGKVAIIGCGIYGCHIALSLAEAGFGVTLFDKEDEIFMGASGNCAFRIHRGYHYLRSEKTRALCAVGHDLFMHRYAHLTCNEDEATEKLFIMSEDGRSHIDYGTAKHVLTGSTLEATHLSIEDTEKYGIMHGEGAFTASEPMLYADYPREWFKHALTRAGCKFMLGEQAGYVKHIGAAADGVGIAINGQSFDFAVNCTYNQAFSYTPSSQPPSKFQLCIVPVAVLREGKQPFSFGVFDGPFPSIEPYLFKGDLPARFARYKGRHLYQIWHVRHIVWKSFDKAEDAWKACKQGLTEDEMEDSIKKTVADLLYFYPGFDQHFEICGVNLAIKTMAMNASDTRPLIVVNDVSVHPRLFTVVSSKLSSIFSAEKDLLLTMLRAVAEDADVSSIKRSLELKSFWEELIEPAEDDIVRAISHTPLSAADV